MGNAYAAKAAAAVPVTIPTGWPAWWPFPTTDAGPWAPGWPLTSDGVPAKPANLSMTVDAAASIAVGGTIAVEGRILLSGVDTNTLNNHLVKVTAAISGRAINVKKQAGDAFSGAIYYQVSNYSGIRYGINPTFYANVLDADSGSTLTITFSVVSVDSPLTGSDGAAVTGALVGRVHLCGGHTSGADSGDVDALTIGTNSWAAKTNMLGPTRAQSFGAVVSNKGYVYGGTIGVYLVDTDENDPAADTWVEKLNMPTALGLGGSSSIGTSAYSFAGYTTGVTRTKSVYQYTPSGNTWTAKMDIPSPSRGNNSAATINGRAYSFCGTGKDRSESGPADYRPYCDEYDASFNTWANKADAPTSRRCTGGAFASGVLGFVVGGYNGSMLQLNEQYNPATNAWSSKASVPSPARETTAAVAVADIGYLIGGSDGFGGTLGDCDEYTPGTDAWVSKSDMPSPNRRSSTALSLAS